MFLLGKKRKEIVDIVIGEEKNSNLDKANFRKKRTQSLIQIPLVGARATAKAANTFQPVGPAIPRGV